MNWMNECQEKRFQWCDHSSGFKLSIVFTLKVDLLRYDLFIACSVLSNFVAPVDSSLSQAPLSTDYQEY